MKRLVCVTERLIHFCVGVYLLHSLADRDLSLQILYKTPQVPVVRKPINAKLRIKSKVLFSLVEKVLKVQFYA